MSTPEQLRKVANERAAGFMRQAFDVDTSKSPFYETALMANNQQEEG